MPWVKRTGIDNRMIVRNSKVYASPVNKYFNGLFAYRDLEAGEILVQYTGDILTQAQANASDSEYLFDVFYRSRPNADTVIRKTIDGRGELMGFANNAPKVIANAQAIDILPTLIENNMPYKERTALVLVTKHKILTGSEIRFNYNEHDDGEMVQMMKQKGVTDDQLRDRSFLTLRYVTPPERNHAGMIEPDFPYQFMPWALRALRSAVGAR